MSIVLWVREVFGAYLIKSNNSSFVCGLNNVKIIMYQKPETFLSFRTVILCYYQNIVFNIFVSQKVFHSLKSFTAHINVLMKKVTGYIELEQKCTDVCSTIYTQQNNQATGEKELFFFWIQQTDGKGKNHMVQMFQLQQVNLLEYCPLAGLLYLQR